MEQPEFTPPAWAMRIFRRICREDYLEEIEGDLLELYEQKAASTSPARLRWAFILEVFLLIRPRLLRSLNSKYMNPMYMLQDHLKVSYRNLRKYRSYTFINVLGLSAGMAAAILLFLVINYERSFDGFHSKAADIYRVAESKEGGTPSLQTRTPLGPALKTELPEVLHSARVINWYSPWIESETGRVQQSVRFTDDDFADMFDFEVREGDLKAALTSKDHLVITEKTAKILFGFDKAVGKTVKEIQGGKNWTVGAVVADPPSNTSMAFELLSGWINIPEYLKDPSLANWYNTFMTTYVLLTPGTRPAAISDKLASIVTENFTPQDEAQKYEIALIPITELRGFETENKALINLLAVVALIILAIAAFNIINLASAQSFGRLREVTIRKVIGSSRGQLVAQFLTESLLINLLATGLAWLVLWFAIPLLEERFDITFQYTSGDWAVMAAVTAGFGLLLGLVSGIFPALVISAVKASDGIRGKVLQRDGNFFFRNGLLVFQFAASVFMIAGTIVVWKQIDYMKSRDLHFDADQVVVVPVFDATFVDGDKAKKQLQTLVKEYASVPGIEKVSFGQNVPGRHWQNYNNFADRDQPENQVHMRQATVHSAYFETIGVELIAGRSFNHELASDSNAVVINRKAMETLGWKSIEGKQLLSGGDAYPFRVVGVTEDFHYRSLQKDIQPFVHFMGRASFNYMLVRFQPGEARKVLERLEQDWASLNPLQGLDYFFLDEEFAGLYQEQERIAFSAGFFSIIAVIIASLGLFSMASFTIRRKRKEISIRKVMGATVPQLATLLSRHYLLLVAAAFAVAAPVALYVMRIFLSDFAYRVSLSGFEFVIAGLLVLVFALVSIAFIVLRASSENPAQALRNE